MSKKSLTFFLCFLLFALNTFAQSSNRPLDVNEYSLSISKGAAISVMAIDVENGDVILEINSQQRMTPASLTKVITTGAVLSTLKPDYTYQTDFLLKQQKGKASLWVKGSGDPTFGSDSFDVTKSEFIFNNILKALQSNAITKLEKLIIDNTCYSDVLSPSKRLWEDMANYYGAIPNGLSYRENTFKLTLQSPEGINQPVKIINTTPRLDVHFNCLVKTANNNKDSAYIYGHPAMKQWYVSGSIPQNREAFTIKGALPYPERTFANELLAYLEKHGIEAKSIDFETIRNVTVYDIIYSHASPNLAEIASVVNKTSHNLFADHLLFLLAQNQCGKASWDNGVKALQQFWTSALNDFSGVFYDGSGLSPFNAFSANDMVNVLKYMHHSEHSEIFKQSLAVAGVDGTLRSILKDKSFKAKVIGKSGSFNGVLGYCGYISTDEDRTVAFCIMANRFTESYSEIRQNMERLMKEIILKN